MRPTLSNGRRIAGWRNAAVLLAAAIVPLAIARADIPAAGGPQELPHAAAVPDKQVATLLTDAQRALAAGNLQLALIQLKNAVKAAPDNADVRTRLGVVLMASGDAPAAERELRQALADGASKPAALPALFEAMLSLLEYKELLHDYPDPGDSKSAEAPDILRARALAQQALGQTADAAASMDRSLALRRDGAGLLARAQLAERQGAADLATKSVDEALALDPQNASAMLLKAQLLQRAGQTDQALTLVDQVIEKRPQNLSARAERIGMLMDLKQDDKAKVDIDALLARSPNLPLGLYFKALIQARAKDTAGAWETAQAIPPQFVQGSPGVAAAIAQIAIASHNLEFGEAILTAAIARETDKDAPDSIRVREMLAALKISRNKPAEAQSVLAPLKESNDPQVLALLAQAALQSNQAGDAITYLTKASAQPGSGSDLLRQELALTEMRAGRTDDAIEQLTELVAHDNGHPEIAGLLISALTRAGKYDQASAAIDQLQQKLAKSPLPDFYRGQLQSQQGHLEAAADRYGDALRQNPSFVPAQYYRADIEARQGELQKASDDISDILKRDPKNEAALLKQAEIEARQNKVADVKATLQTAVANAPQDPKPLLALGNYQVIIGDDDGALATVQALSKVSPDNPDALNLAGKIQLAKGDKQAAVTTYRELAAKVPNSPLPEMLLAQALAVSGDQSGALDALKAALKIDPSHLQARQALISIEAKAGDRDGPITLAQEYRTSHPGPQADQLLAYAMVQTNRLSEAKATLTSSLAKQQDDGVAIALSELYVHAGEAQNAKTFIADYASHHPADPAVLATYAALLLSTDPKAAANEYEALLKLQPDDPIALNNLGWILLKDDPKRALELVTRAAQIAPRSPSIVDTLGWLKFKSGDDQDALPLLQRAHELNKSDPAIGYHLAAALNGAGRGDEAKTLLHAVLTTNTHFDGVDEATQLEAQLK